jgi:hypothetical protein
MEAFHHIDIQSIIGISWNKIRELRNENETVQKIFCNISKVESFIVKRTDKYITKILSLNKVSYPKQFLGLWIQATRKTGAPQTT